MPLTNRRILIVEDEYMLARDLQLELEEAGAIVIGSEASVRSALSRIEQEERIDAVILDVNLGGQFAFPVADALNARQIPFIFASGYEDDVVKSRYPGVVNCAKPFVSRRLLHSLENVLH
ncbi:response regulator [Sphingomonas sanguinis]|uniref:Response regulator n=1 Tax=Sphingomonas sanguinis TaxID=33051 RepID=A0ABU5LN17_9SPHN|nr:response regulator [Sphingomonas sanguinis]MDZ7281315.1 response regulator [Sphingomonas sanguinis]